MKRYFAIISILSIFVLAIACKPPYYGNSSETKTLDNLASSLFGGELRENMCGQTDAERRAEKASPGYVHVEALDRGTVLYPNLTPIQVLMTKKDGYDFSRINDHFTTGDELSALYQIALENAVERTLAFVPRSLLAAFQSTGGRIDLSHLEGLQAICSNVQEHDSSQFDDKFVALSCWKRNPNGQVTIYIDPVVDNNDTPNNPRDDKFLGINHALVRALGYVLGEAFFNYEYTSDGVFKDKGQPTQESGRLLADIAAAFKSDLARQGKGGFDVANKVNQHYVLAEAFDSFYCSTQTRTDMSHQFPQTYRIMNELHANLSPVVQAQTPEATPVVAALTKSRIPVQQYSKGDVGTLVSGGKGDIKQLPTQTTYNKGGTTQAPTQTTYNKGGTTQAPTQTTYNKGGTTQAPTQTTYNKGGTTQAPTQTTYNKGGTTQAPVYNKGGGTVQQPRPNPTNAGRPIGSFFGQVVGGVTGAIGAVVGGVVNTATNVVGTVARGIAYPFNKLGQLGRYQGGANQGVMSGGVVGARKGSLPGSIKGAKGGTTITDGSRVIPQGAGGKYDTSITTCDKGMVLQKKQVASQDPNQVTGGLEQECVPDPSFVKDSSEPYTPISSSGVDYSDKNRFSSINDDEVTAKASKKKAKISRKKTCGVVSGESQATSGLLMLLLILLPMVSPSLVVVRERRK